MVIYKIKLTRIEKDYDSYVNSIQIEKKESKQSISIMSSHFAIR